MCNEHINENESQGTVHDTQNLPVKTEASFVELKMNNKLDVFNFLDKGLNIFNFHPIHIFLNSEKLQRYENSRHIHHDPKELIKIRFNGYGVRTFFKKLIDIEK